MAYRRNIFDIVSDLGAQALQVDVKPLLQGPDPGRERPAETRDSRVYRVSEWQGRSSHAGRRREEEQRSQPPLPLCPYMDQNERAPLWRKYGTAWYRSAREAIEREQQPKVVGEREKEAFSVLGKYDRWFYVHNVPIWSTHPGPNEEMSMFRAIIVRRAGGFYHLISEVEFIRPDPLASYLTARLAFTGAFSDVDDYMANYSDSPKVDFKPWGGKRADMTLQGTLQAGVDAL